MKKKKYLNCDFHLKKILFEFDDSSDNEKFGASMKDKIVINKIKENLIEFESIRLFEFENLENTKFEIKYECSLVTESLLNKSEFIDDIKKGIDFIDEVYNNISLLIANITNHTLFELTITPPFYNRKDIIVE